jgi:type II secretory pathway pseudopilin PulG
MNQRSRSTLFLIEQLIVVAVFAICSAACVRILTSAYFDARKSRDVSNAILVAESAAESYKSVSGNIDKVSEIMDGVREGAGSTDSITIYYDKEWASCSKNEAQYVLRLISGKPDTASELVLTCDILIERISGVELISFTVATRS